MPFHLLMRADPAVPRTREFTLPEYAKMADEAFRKAFGVAGTLPPQQVEVRGDRPHLQAGPLVGGPARARHHACPVPSHFLSSCGLVPVMQPRLQRHEGTPWRLPQQAAYWRERATCREDKFVEYGNDVEGTAFSTSDVPCPLAATDWNLQVRSFLQVMHACMHAHACTVMSSPHSNTHPEVGSRQACAWRMLLPWSPAVGSAGGLARAKRGWWWRQRPGLRNQSGVRGSKRASCSRGSVCPL